MSASSDQQLQELYLELAEAQASRGQMTEATDAYALALYYARRLGNNELVARCRSVISQHNPNHVASREIAAPLFFAQLLMRYPAEEAHISLAKLRQTEKVAPQLEPAVYETTLSPFSSGSFLAGAAPTMIDVPAESTPRAVATPTMTENTTARPLFNLASPKSPGAMGPSFPNVTPDSAPPPVRRDPAARPAPNEFENHHWFDLGSSSATGVAPSARVVEDLLLSEGDSTREDHEDEAETLFSRAVHHVGMMSVVVGILAICFFGYDLYGSIPNVDLHKVVDTVLNEVDFAWAQPASADKTVDAQVNSKAPVEITIEDDIESEITERLSLPQIGLGADKSPILERR